MAILLRDVSDDEIARSCEIESLAYKNNPIAPIVAPGPFPPESTQQKIEELIELRKDDPTVHYVQAVDEDTGRMIAFAKWNIYKASEAAAAPSRPLTFGPGRNKEACIALYGSVAERKRELMADRPHIYLHTLHTDPEFQGRGAGGLLVDWGTKKADELGVPMYLESSKAGHRLYQKHGFKDIELFKVDLTRWGGPVHEQPLMIREPSKLSGAVG